MSPLDLTAESTIFLSYLQLTRTSLRWGKETYTYIYIYVHTYIHIVLFISSVKTQDPWPCSNLWWHRVERHLWPLRNLWCSGGDRWIIKDYNWGTSLVAQWLRIRLPMQWTRVRAPVWEGPTCRGAAKPVCQNCWAWALEPASHNYWAHVPQLPKPAHLEPVLRNKRNHRSEKPAHHNKE